MFFDSSDSLAQTQSTMTPLDFLQAKNLYTPTGAEAASASFWTSLDRTLGARIYENYELYSAEQDALTEGSTFRYLTEDDYKKSEDYVPGVKYERGMTRARAQILRENYDERRRLEEILNLANRNGSGWLYTPTTFTAGMIGSLPDPINLATMVIPGGALVTGARLAGMTGKQLLMQSLKPSIIGMAAATNLVSSGIAAWDLNDKGENITMRDVLMDAMMGAVLAPVFHTAGSLFSRTRVRRGLRNSFDDLRVDLPEGSEVAKLAQRMKERDPDAYRIAGQHLERLTDSTGRTMDAVDFVRNRISPEERLELSRWMEFAVTEMSEGRALDMSKIAQGSPVLKRIEGLVNEYRRTQQEAPVVIDTVNAAKDTIKGLETTLSKLEKDFGVAVHFALGERHGLGEALARVRQLTAETKATLSELTNLQDARTATIDTIKAAQDTLAKAQAEYKAYGDALFMPESLRKHLGAEPLAKMEATIAEAQAKLADIERQIKEKLGDTTPASIDRIDYRPAENRVATQGEPEPLLSSVDKTRAQEIVDSGVDPKTGISEVEALLKNLTPEEQAMLDAHTVEGARINRKERVALEESSFIECIMGAGALL